MKSIKDIVIFKGKSKKVVSTMDITLDDLRIIFFPKNFYEKYKYLGQSYIGENGKYFKALYPLILAMDYKAKPKYCPRWFLRFLELFGNDNSIVRVRNWKLSKLHNKLTKGIRFIDWKTKWANYDLRISVGGPEDIMNLADNIEKCFYEKGYKKELIENIKKLNPEFDKNYLSITDLQTELNKLEALLEVKNLNKSKKNDT